MNKPKFYFDLEQNTPEWFEIRKGRITSSGCDSLFTNPYTATGKLSSGGILIGTVALSKGAVTLAENLVIDSLVTDRGERYSNKYMDWGHLYEDEAAEFFELKTFERYSKVGFVTYGKNLGGSPDRINPKKKKGLEIKCPKAETHFKYLRNPSLLEKTYKAQVLFLLYITGFESWDLVSYCPKYELKHRMVRRTITLPEKERNIIAEQSKAVVNYSKTLKLQC